MKEIFKKIIRKLTMLGWSLIALSIFNSFLVGVMFWPVEYIFTMVSCSILLVTAGSICLYIGVKENNKFIWQQKSQGNQ